MYNLSFRIVESERVVRGKVVNTDSLVLYADLPDIAGSNIICMCCQTDIDIRDNATKSSFRLSISELIMSFPITIQNRMGDKTAPCLTPLSIEKEEETSPLNRMAQVGLVYQLLISRHVFPVDPCRDDGVEHHTQRCQKLSPGHRDIDKASHHSEEVSLEPH